jgi:2',3'-cyclic-nucleotide 2'-phosphodiesterase (5'-nucleotidase family)
MKFSTSSLSRTVFVSLVLTVSATLAGASLAAEAHNPNRLAILSTTDVKGKTSPCGCSIPKGGFARRATFADSMKADYDKLVIVDAGGYFPEFDTHQDVAWFMMDEMKALGLTAIGVGDRDLRFGLSFLKQQSARTGLPVVSANLFDAKGMKTVFDPYVVRTIGGVKVGIFGVISPKAVLGPAKDSLSVGDPEVAAKRAVAALRKQGATAIIALAQLGQIESEDLAADVEGIDAVIAGRDVGAIEQGKVVKNTVIVFGGDQSMSIGRITLSLDAKNHVTGGNGGTVVLGPGIAEQPEVLAKVKAFEDVFNERMRALEKQKLGTADAKTSSSTATPSGQP